MMLREATPSEHPIPTEKTSMLTFSEEPLMQLSRMALSRHFGRTTRKTCVRLTENQTIQTNWGTA